MSEYWQIAGRPNSRIVLCCEHASNDVPPEYAGLGLSSNELDEHIAWDIGAADVTRFVADALGVSAVLAGASRLLVDCNRGPGEQDLIVESSDGVAIPGNRAIDAHERRRRISRFYEPYHEAVDRALEQHRQALLLSIHSFTPALRTGPNAVSRAFDAGVLFDDHSSLAERLGRGLEQNRLRVRYNEPYSGLAGLIYSARSHGIRHDRRYLELELNNTLLRDEKSIRSVAGLVATAIEHLLEAQ